MLVGLEKSYCIRINPLAREQIKNYNGRSAGKSGQIFCCPEDHISFRVENLGKAATVGLTSNWLGSVNHIDDCRFSNFVDGNSDSSISKFLKSLLGRYKDTESWDILY